MGSLILSLTFLFYEVVMVGRMRFSDSIPGSHDFVAILKFDQHGVQFATRQNLARLPISIW